MIFSILLDGGLSRNGPLLELSESVRGDIPGTHPHTLTVRFLWTGLVLTAEVLVVG
jgi:hypothetical protein